MLFECGCGSVSLNGIGLFKTSCELIFLELILFSIPITLTLNLFRARKIIQSWITICVVRSDWFLEIWYTENQAYFTITREYIRVFFHTQMFSEYICSLFLMSVSQFNIS